MVSLVEVWVEEVELMENEIQVCFEELWLLEVLLFVLSELLDIVMFVKCMFEGVDVKVVFE